MLQERWASSESALGYSERLEAPSSQVALLLSHLRVSACQWSESLPEVALMLLGKLKLRSGHRFVERLYWIASDLIERSPKTHTLHAVRVTICREGDRVKLHLSC